MYELREYAGKELPPVGEAIELALKFASTVESEWTASKLFDDVQTYTTWSGGQFWAARVSTHRDLTYDEMRDTLFHGHTENEAQYIGMIESYELLDGYKEWQSRRANYKFPFPLKNRDMVFWLAQKETKPGSQFVNVTVPRKAPSKFTKAFYVSFEVVTKLEDGSVNWIMGTTSEAGGWVPQVVQRPQMSKAVAEDIPQYRKWMESRRKSQPSTQASQVPQSPAQASQASQSPAQASQSPAQASQPAQATQ